MRRLLRGRGLLGTPIRAVNRRLVPWIALGLLAPAVALFVLSRSYTVSVEQLAVTLPQSSALPGHVAGFAAFAALLACGAVVMIVRLGARLGRAGRVSAERVLFCFCAVYLILPCADAVARDPLPLAPAVAVLIGAGAHALLALAFGVLARRRAT